MAYTGSLEAKVEALEQALGESKRELAVARERIASLVGARFDQAVCLEFDPPIPVTLSPEEQAERILESGVIALCNEAAARQYGGLEPSAVIGKRIMDIMGHARDLFRRHLIKFVRDGYSQDRKEYSLALAAGGEAELEIDRRGTI